MTIGLYSRIVRTACRPRSTPCVRSLQPAPWEERALPGWMPHPRIFVALVALVHPGASVSGYGCP